MRRTRYLLRGLGVVLAFSPVALLGASLVFALLREGERHLTAIAIMLFALAIGALNFHLSFVRGRLYLRTNGSLDGYKHISGLPLVGSLAVVVGTILGFGSTLCALLGVLAVAIDTGGAPWLVIATWRDRALWDRRG